jgi:hypothetical protein
MAFPLADKKAVALAAMSAVLRVCLLADLTGGSSASK